MTYLQAITLIHTALSLIAIVAGIRAVAGLFSDGLPPPSARLFLTLAVLTSVTGFFFPFHRVTPAMITGVIALLVLAAALFAFYGRQLSGAWRPIYAAGLVVSLYLLVFVGVVQAFQKIAPLAALAPTQSEPPFVATQLIVLLGFIALGWRAARLPGPAAPTGRA